MRVDQKAWGVARQIYQGSHVEVWHASIRAGGLSSGGRFHRHLSKHNDFYVVSGVLEIDWPQGEFSSTTQLQAGWHFSLPPGHWHRFRAITDVELIETYWLPSIDPDDIQRANALAVDVRSMQDYVDRLEYREPVGATFTGG